MGCNYLGVDMLRSCSLFSWKIYSTEKEYVEGDKVYEEIVNAVSVEESEAPDDIFRERSGITGCNIIHTFFELAI